MSDGPFYHFVLIKFHEPQTEAFFEQVNEFIRRIKDEVPGLMHYYFGENTSDRGNGYTHFNLSIFETSAHHDAYQLHPLHHEMRDLMVPRMDIVVCDYDAEGRAHSSD